MILSVSRRTDIPAFYSEWFINRLAAGYVYVRNPMNFNQVSKIDIRPEVTDCIVFWSKNPQPLLEKLDIIDQMGYQYYFQFTITPYNNKIERALPDKKEISRTFIKLSKRIGKDKVIWRYDPIILNSEWTIQAHIKAFEEMAAELSEHTQECIISFVDPYQKTMRRNEDSLIRSINESEMCSIAEAFSEIAGKVNVKVKTCAEGIDLDRYGIEHASCIGRAKIESIIQCSLTDKLKKDEQREHCGCIQCIDIGAYNTCQHGCRYCYATISPKEAMKNYKLHDPKFALLIGDGMLIEKVSERKVKSLKVEQMNFL